MISISLVIMNNYTAKMSLIPFKHVTQFLIGITSFTHQSLLETFYAIQRYSIVNFRNQSLNRW